MKLSTAAGTHYAASSIPDHVVGAPLKLGEAPAVGGDDVSIPDHVVGAPLKLDVAGALLRLRADDPRPRGRGPVEAKQDPLERDPKS